jgi:UDP-N-acetylmuramoyl-L-alanyl-D-glutamate--2,6-diaminopimelate ligase
MAKVACEWSDKVIITSDNPRTEDPAQIIEDMKQGVDPAFKRHTLAIADRREAIKTACMLAQPGDIIWCWPRKKGVEKYQEIRTG